MEIPKSLKYKGVEYPIHRNDRYQQSDYFRGRHISHCVGEFGKAPLIIAVIDEEILVVPSNPQFDEGYLLPAPFPTFDAALAHVAMMDSIAA